MDKVENPINSITLEHTFEHGEISSHSRKNVSPPKCLYVFHVKYSFVPDIYCILFFHLFWINDWTGSKFELLPLCSLASKNCHRLYILFLPFYLSSSLSSKSCYSHVPGKCASDTANGYKLFKTLKEEILVVACAMVPPSVYFDPRRKEFPIWLVDPGLELRC
jgi:hypothetical protein